MALETITKAPREKEVIKMNKEERHFYLKSIERMLREVERKMRAYIQILTTCLMLNGLL